MRFRGGIKRVVNRGGGVFNWSRLDVVVLCLREYMGCFIEERIGG